MKLNKKKELAARTLKIGKERISFVKSRLEEIKEAITKQDIRDLVNDKAIIVKDIRGKKKNLKRKVKKSIGNIRKKVNKRKADYVILTRKLRKYISEMKKQSKISSEDVKDLLNKIRNRTFRSKSHLKETLGGLRK